MISRCAGDRFLILEALKHDRAILLPQDCALRIVGGVFDCLTRIVVPPGRTSPLNATSYRSCSRELLSVAASCRKDRHTKFRKRRWSSIRALLPATAGTIPRAGRAGYFDFRIRLTRYASDNGRILCIAAMTVTRQKIAAIPITRRAEFSKQFPG